MKSKIAIALAILGVSGCSSVDVTSSQSPAFDGYEKAYSVNKYVNDLRYARGDRGVRYVDRPRYYIPLELMREGGEGNCLDFAIMKCSLMSKEVEPSRLSIWAYKRYTGIGHAVCVIDGKYALDWKNAPISFTKSALGADMKEPELREYNAIGFDWKGK